MNNKENILLQVLDIVVSCCSYELDGVHSVTRDSILGADKRENVVWSRCMLVSQLRIMGFSNATCSMLLHKGEPSIRKMFRMSTELHDTSIAYRIAESEVAIRCKNLYIENGE